MGKLFTFKTLLLAAGLLMGSGSAWSAEVWDFTNSTVWGTVALPAAGNSYADCSYNASGEAATTGNYVTFHSTTGALLHASTATNGIGFDAIGSSSDHYVKLTVPAGATATVVAYVSGNRNVKVYFNGAESAAFANSSWANESKDFINNTANPLDLYVYCSANKGGAGQAPFLRSITLKQTVQVTTNYIDTDDNIIKTSVVENVEVGNNYSPTYTTPYYVSDTDPYTYTYVSGASEDVITAAKTYNIVYSKTARTPYTFNVTQSYGSNNQKIVDEQTVYEGASFTYYYPRFILDGATLYEYSDSDDPNKDLTFWKSTSTNVAANANYTLTYIAKDGACVYYSEAEDITGATIYNNGTWAPRSSNGSLAVLSSKVLTSLDAGTYTVTSRGIGKIPNSGENAMKLYKGSVDDENLLLSFATSNSNNTSATEHTSDAFSLTATTDLVAHGGYNTASENGFGFDYIYVMAISVPVTITAAGYATFSSDYALDLAKANLPSGLTAYYVNSGDVTSTTATFTEPDKAVAAGEGLLFAGTAGETYNISVAATGDALTGNALKATDGSAVAAGKYVFAYENANPTTTAGFYQLGSATAVAAGKAYLDTASSAKVLRFVFGDGTATGIDGVSGDNGISGDDGEAIYNVAGQQVDEDYKGIVIKGGKKYLQK